MAEWLTLKCPTCGGRLKFDRSTQVFSCEHCGNLHLLENDAEKAPIIHNLPKRDWIRVGNFDILLHEVVDAWVSGQRVIYINVEYWNRRSKETLSCRYNQWVLFDRENYSYEAISADRQLFEDQGRPFFGAERFLNRTMHARGWMAFKVPATAQIMRLQFLTGFLNTSTVDILLTE